MFERGRVRKVVKSRLLIASSLLAGSLVALAGCGATTTSAGATTNTITGPITQMGTYMDWTKTVYSRMGGSSLVQEPLVTLSPANQIEPGAATSWSVSKNKLVWTFHLRKGLTWSNGAPLVAVDYVDGFQRSANPATGYDFGWFWGTVVHIKNWNKIAKGQLPATDLGVKAVNADTLQITTDVPVPFMPLAMVYGWPIPPGEVSKYGAAWATHPSTMLFSGPYIVKKWVVNQYIEFAKNPHYRGPAKATTNTITLDLTNEDDYNSFLTGQVDWTLLNPGQYREAKHHLPSNSHLVSVPQWWINMLGFNQNSKPFNSPKVRRAFMLAINRRNLVTNVLKGLATPDSSVVPKGFPGYDPNIHEPYNVAEAKKLLAEAGYPGGNGFPSETLLIRNEAATIGTTLPAAEYIQAQLKSNLGITIQVKVLDMPTWISDVNSGKAQMFIRPYNFDYVDPSDWYSLFLPTGVMTWNNSQYNTLVNEANTSFNTKARAAEYNKAAQILNQQAGAVFLWTNQLKYLVSNKIKNFPNSPSISLDSAWIGQLHVKP